MMADKSPEEQFAETRARLAISQQYLARDDNPDLDPSRQDQIDKNRIPGEFGTQQLSPNSEVRARAAEHDTRRNEDAAARVGENLARTLTKSLEDKPYMTLGLAAMAGFALGAIWKS